MPDHDKRVALVIGGNRGLAQRGFTVILGVRDPNKGATACSRLQGEGLDANFELLEVTELQCCKTDFDGYNIVSKIKWVPCSLGHSGLYKGGLYEKTPSRIKNSSNFDLCGKLYGG